MATGTEEQAKWDADESGRYRMLPSTGRRGSVPRRKIPAVGRGREYSFSVIVWMPRLLVSVTGRVDRDSYPPQVVAVALPAESRRVIGMMRWVKPKESW